MASSSFQSHHSHQPPPPNPTTIEALESSILHLVTNWQRRQRCQLLFLLPFCSCGHHHNAMTKRAPWRINLANLLDSLPIHIATIVLLLLDLTLTILDLSSSLFSCNSKSHKENSSNLYHWIGITVLSLLSAKVVALAVALGCSFFTSPGHVIDGLVMIGALVLEVVADGKGAGLLVVVSLWRVVRVAESAFELSNEAIEAQIEGVLMQFEVLRAENRRLEEVVVEKDKRIKQLEEELAKRKHTFVDRDGSL